MSGRLVDKRNGATAAGYTRCSGCSEWSRCTCSPRRSKREIEDQQDREADAYLKAHGRLGTKFGNRSGRLK